MQNPWRHNQSVLESPTTTSVLRNHTGEIATHLSRSGGYNRFMCNKYDPQHEAEAAMKRAAAAEGADRQRLIELAIAWHQLARERREDEPTE
ncbi:hypothetical protein GGD63_000483 [Bradyrhizobium sp. cir1]|uniref:hypothetical protein n=1 Tax=Bradyrhizobium sp. cir1 TaxID=1445730 RepID=UPI001606A517|nr:hypothetical protein [Bradyrhizobium sp. cir1]MBB4367714.1 hypothetical protein [Bradyrhizobium sp. cir1]